MANNAVKKNKLRIIVKKDMYDYSNDPYFVEKAEKATAFLKKNGLPEAIKKNKNSK